MWTDAVEDTFSLSIWEAIVGASGVYGWLGQVTLNLGCVMRRYIKEYEAGVKPR